MFVKAKPKGRNGGKEEEEEEEEIDLTFFQKCMKAILNMYQHKIYGSDRDFLGILFFGTDINNTGEDFKHIFQLQVL